MSARVLSSARLLSSARVFAGASTSLAVICAVFAAGCIAGVPREELPEEPLAFIRQDASRMTSLENFAKALSVLDPGETETEPANVETLLTLLYLRSGEMDVVPDAGARTFPLDWSDDGIFLLMGRSGIRRGELEMYTWNRHTGATNRVTPSFTTAGGSMGSGPIRLASVGVPSRRGRAMRGERGIVVDVDRVGSQALAGAEGGELPDVAPDGRSVVFVKPHPRATREPFIYLASLDDEEPRLLARGDLPRFSRDGRFITYVSRRRGSDDVWLMRADGGGKRAIAATSFEETTPAVSPRGRFVVYASARGTDSSQLFLARVRDGREIQLTANGQSGRPIW